MSQYQSKYQKKYLKKYQNLTVLFCTLMLASLFLGQQAKATFTYAPLTGGILGVIFCVLATITSIKVKKAKSKRRR